MEKTVNQRFKIMRQLLGIGQSELATALKCKQSTISAIELEKQALTPKMMQQLYKQFDISKYWLLEGKGEMIAVPGAVPANNSENEWKEAAYNNLKADNDRMALELKNLWALINNITGGSGRNFPLASDKVGAALRFSGALSGAQLARA